eukprot:6001098-Pleurochrysis_carterae.AAC.2
MEAPVTFAEHMVDDGVEAGQLTWGFTWREFLKYAQRGDRGRSAKENASTDKLKEETRTRETHPTLYPGEVLGENEASGEPARHRRNLRELTDRAKANQHRRERKEETYKNKRLRLAEGENGTRRVSERPEPRLGGGEWELPPHREDRVARMLMEGQDSKGMYRVFKDETMNLAHEEEYSGHPILRLCTQPEKMVNAHMKTASGRKVTYDTLNVALSLHEKHCFHLAVATGGSKKGGNKDRGETQRLSETTYGVWQEPKSAEILRSKQREASALQKRLGVTLDQMDKTRAVEQGVLKGRLGDSATAAEAELFAIFAILRKAQAKQEMRHYGSEKARILIISDCLSGLRTIEKVWRGRRCTYRKMQNGAVLEAITNARENLGTVIFMWIPSNVGIIPNVIADNIAAQEQETTPEGMVTGLISKQVKSRPII